MKFSNFTVASLLASVAVARPQTKEDGDPMPQTSRVTAFVVSDDGTPSVECWEIAHMVDDLQIKRADGSKATAYSVQIAAARELDGLDILTWPAYSPIWPSSDNDEMKAKWFDLSQFNNLFSIQGGLVNLNINSRVSEAADEPQNYVFDLENGDDWFYFEDNYTGSTLAKSVDAAPPPFTISTVSGSETEVLRLRFPDQPKHKVLHKGGCSFSGVETLAPSSAGRKSRVHKVQGQQPLHKTL